MWWTASQAYALDAITGATEMKNAILSVVLILISYLIASVMPVDTNPISCWLAMACLISGFLGLAAGFVAWCDW